MAAIFTKSADLNFIRMNILAVVSVVDDPAQFHAD